jgi:mRNA interferase MazF
VTPVPRRGELWLIELDKRRPAVILTRDPMGRYLSSVLVAPITSTVRGLSTEVPVGPPDGVRRQSVANLDSAQRVDRTRLVRRLGAVGAPTMDAVCRALAFATGC